MDELDVVQLLVHLPKYGLHIGEEGTIVHIFHEPTLAYLVEFVDELGRERAECTLLPEQIERVWGPGDSPAT